MKKLIIVLSFLPTLAFAQVPQPLIEYTVKLTAAEIDIVGKALGKMSYEDVALLIQKLRQQIVEQQNKPVENLSSSEKK